MPFTGYGVYELVLFRALLVNVPAPWSVENLNALEEVITERFCAKYWPGRRPHEVLDWIRALGPEDRKEVIARCNSSWSSSQRA